MLIYTRPPLVELEDTVPLGTMIIIAGLLVTLLVMAVRSLVLWISDRRDEKVRRIREEQIKQEAARVAQFSVSDHEEFLVNIERYKRDSAGHCQKG